MSAPLLLAPMEGLTDFHMRDALTRLARYDWCVTEFIRVSDRVLPRRVFLQACPELRSGARTAAGTPVHLQLLGSDPELMAGNAARAAEMGAPAIDLNFGCPAKTVNHHRGGAILLDEPETVHAIVAAVRRAVPPEVPVSAKMRLGVRDRARMLDNARGIEAAGASWLTVHARTKDDGYRPPAHWEAVAEIVAAVTLPVVANGEIWTPDDAARCRAVAGTAALMLGRGAVTRPDLAARIAGRDDLLAWPALVQAQLDFLAHMETAHRYGEPLDNADAALMKAANVVEPLRWTEGGIVGRYKQWLGMLTRGFAEAGPLFHAVKRTRRLAEVRALLLASAGPPAH